MICLSLISRITEWPQQGRGRGETQIEDDGAQCLQHDGSNDPLIADQLVAEVSAEDL